MNTSIRSVPTVEQRAGDFSKSFNQAGALIRVFNPFTTRASGTGFIRDQFTDNKIPTNLIDPVALNILKYFPLPNQPGDANTNANNYAASGSTRCTRLSRAPKAHAARRSSASKSG